MKKIKITEEQAKKLSEDLVQKSNIDGWVQKSDISALAHHYAKSNDIQKKNIIDTATKEKGDVFANKIKIRAKEVLEETINENTSGGSGTGHFNGKFMVDPNHGKKKKPFRKDGKIVKTEDKEVDMFDKSAKISPLAKPLNEKHATLYPEGWKELDGMFMNPKNKKLNEAKKAKQADDGGIDEFSGGMDAVGGDAGGDAGAIDEQIITEEGYDDNELTGDANLEEPLEETTSTGASSGAYSSKFFVDPKHGSGQKPLWPGGEIIAPNRKKHNQGVDAFKITKKSLKEETLNERHHSYVEGGEQVIDEASNPMLEKVKSYVKREELKLGQIELGGWQDRYNAEPLAKMIVASKNEDEFAQRIYKFIYKEWDGTKLSKLRLQQAKEYYARVVRDLGLKRVATQPDPNRINQSEYTTYVCMQIPGGKLKLISGYQYAPDAREYAQEVKENFPEAKVSIYSKTFLVSKGINPDDNSSWGSDTRAGNNLEVDQNPSFRGPTNASEPTELAEDVIPVLNIDESGDYMYEGLFGSKGGMLRFDLKRYSTGNYDVITKNKRPAKILATNLKGEYPIAANVESSEDSQDNGETYNIVDGIMAFEDGSASNKENIELFSHLVKSGMAYKLQGSYGRVADALISDGILDEQGNINWDVANENIGGDENLSNEFETAEPENQEIDNGNMDDDIMNEFESDMRTDTTGDGMDYQNMDNDLVDEDSFGSDIDMYEALVDYDGSDNFSQYDLPIHNNTDADKTMMGEDGFNPEEIQNSEADESVVRENGYDKSDGMGVSSKAYDILDALYERKFVINYKDLVDVQKSTGLHIDDVIDIAKNVLYNHRKDEGIEYADGFSKAASRVKELGMKQYETGYDKEIDETTGTGGSSGAFNGKLMGRRNTPADMVFETKPEIKKDNFKVKDLIGILDDVKEDVGEDHEVFHKLTKELDNYDLPYDNLDIEAPESLVDYFKKCLADHESTERAVEPELKEENTSILNPEELKTNNEYLYNSSDGKSTVEYLGTQKGSPNIYIFSNNNTDEGNETIYLDEEGVKEHISPLDNKLTQLHDMLNEEEKISSAFTNLKKIRDENAKITKADMNNIKNLTLKANKSNGVQFVQDAEPEEEPDSQFIKADNTYQQDQVDLIKKGMEDLNYATEPSEMFEKAFEKNINPPKKSAKVKDQYGFEVPEEEYANVVESDLGDKILADIKKKKEMENKDVPQYHKDTQPVKMIKESEENKFLAIFNGKKIEISATSLWDAKKKAIIELKVPKSKEGLLSVVSQKSQDKEDFKFNEAKVMNEDKVGGNDKMVKDKEVEKEMKGKAFDEKKTKDIVPTKLDSIQEVEDNDGDIVVETEDMVITKEEKKKINEDIEKMKKLFGFKSSTVLENKNNKKSQDMFSNKNKKK